MTAKKKTRPFIVTNDDIRKELNFHDLITITIEYTTELSDEDFDLEMLLTDMEHNSKTGCAEVVKVAHRKVDK